MKQDYYREWIVENESQSFSFYSLGLNGKILKRVEFTHLTQGWYNLAFGDVQMDFSIDDYVVTNNGDTPKVLTTIFRIILEYLEIFPDRRIIFSGSTDSRIRLYRMAISAYFEELGEIIRIFGVKEYGRIVSFKKEINYT